MAQQNMAADTDDTADTGETRKESVQHQQTTSTGQSRISVLYVDDEPELVEMNRRHLQQYDERIELETVRSVGAGQERLAEGKFDCIVSDYAMPGTNGIEFLERVREEDANLPFILYTTRPCEAVATEALSAGATDYVQKQIGTAHLEILADTIVTAVESRRTQRTRNRLLDAIEVIADGVAILDGDGRFTDVNDAYATRVGTESEVLVGESLAHIFEGDTTAGDELLREAHERGRATTTFQTDGGASVGEHVLVQTSPDVVVCLIRLNGDDRPRFG